MEPREDGFTLIELVVAMMVMSLAVAALFGVLDVAFKTSSIDGHRQDAIALADQQLSVLRATPYADLATSSFTQQVGARTYTVSTTVTPLNGYKQATVAVTWTDAAGNPSFQETTNFYSTGAGPHLEPTTSTSTTIAPSSEPLPDGCAITSVTFDSPVAARSSTDPGSLATTDDVTVATTGDPCSSVTLWAGVLTDGSSFSSFQLNPSGSARTGALPANPSAGWGLGVHLVQVFTGPTQDTPPNVIPVAAAEVCVVAPGVSSC